MRYDFGSGEGVDDIPTPVWQIVGGAGRCYLCHHYNAKCVINIPEIEKWRQAFRDGKWEIGMADHTGCQRCIDMGMRCNLPATEEMRRGLKGKQREDAVVSLKRRHVEVELPLRKKVKVPPAEEEDPELDLLQSIEGKVERLLELGAQSEEWKKKSASMLWNISIVSALENKMNLYVLQQVRGDKECLSFNEARKDFIRQMPKTGEGSHGRRPGSAQAAGQSTVADTEGERF